MTWKSVTHLPDQTWLLTNGIGGYALGATDGCNTHRYHGWLVAALTPPVRRIVALHSMVMVLEGGGRGHLLRAQTFDEPGKLHEHTLAPSEVCTADLPRSIGWRWRSANWLVDLTMRLHASANAATVAIRARVEDHPFRLLLRPLTPMRDFHHVEHADRAYPDEAQAAAQIISDSSSDALEVVRDEVRLKICADIGKWHIEPQWWWNLAYVLDAERGQPWREDVWSPGVLVVECPAGEDVSVSCRAEIERDDNACPPQVEDAGESEARDKPTLNSPTAIRSSDDARLFQRLCEAAGQFVVYRRHDNPAGRHVPSGNGAEWMRSIVAGYPWFADWGRDAMISMPGLLLTTGHIADACSVLLMFAKHIKNGLIPNRFDDYGNAAHYNTVDASLWFVHAVGQVESHCENSPDAECGSLASLRKACAEIIAGYRDGTDFNIAMDEDGLIAAGSPDTQLTWMDARRDGVTFTPRHGKAVEINALWYRALRLAQRWLESGRAGELEKRLVCEKTGTCPGDLADRVQSSFIGRFWWAERDCLHDRLIPTDDDWRPDDRLRPNQIIAAALPDSPLDAVHAGGVLRAVERDLLTPYGLRTLAPWDEAYRGRFAGSLSDRDAAYHQGTVWPWLIGPWADAVMKWAEDRAAAAARVRSHLLSLLNALDDGCLGQIAEVYDGDAPHHPGGCCAQAWSVAEVLRVFSRVMNHDA